MNSTLTPSQARRLARSRERRETQERGLSYAERVQRTDLGLAVLIVLAKPGVELTREDIAAWCGCTNEAIRRIEILALRKIRKRRATLVGVLHRDLAA